MCLSCEKGVREIQQTYRSIREQIIVRLGEFGQVMKGGGEDRIFAELVFCILTPQSRAKLCWAAVESLMSKDLLLRVVGRRLCGLCGS